MYSDNRKKIRRFLRDPNGRIFDDAFLMNLWNDEQRIFPREHKIDENVEILRHPPQYQMSYCYDWEWEHSQNEKGMVYQFGLQHRQADGIVCSFVWETQAQGISTGSESDLGYRYTHPWEGFVTGTPAELIPNWFPDDYRETVKMFYDNEPIEFRTWKEITSRDIAYRSYSGWPEFWTIKDDVSNEFYLYPRPTAVWDDIDGDSQVSMVTYAEWIDPQDGFAYDFAFDLDSSSEVGTIMDIPGAETTQSSGLASDYLRGANNVTLVYKKRMAKITADTDEPDIQRHLQKYIEHGVLARAYRANTDGQIKSLADYWDWRKSVDSEVIKRYKSKRMVDRDYRFTSGRGPARRRRGPRLPSTYPDI